MKTESGYFCKKPVAVMAVRIRYADFAVAANPDWPDWLLNAIDDDIVLYSDLPDGTITDVQVKTLEGFLHVSDGSWIIQGVAGELYPCRADVFDKTYEPESATIERSRDVKISDVDTAISDKIRASNPNLGVPIFGTTDAARVAILACGCNPVRG